jgi:hypothetical protein
MGGDLCDKRIYGQISGGISAMLIATDHRIIYLDKQPLFTIIDELNYDIFSGVKSSTAEPFTFVVSYTYNGLHISLCKL